VAPHAAVLLAFGVVFAAATGYRITRREGRGVT